MRKVFRRHTQIAHVLPMHIKVFNKPIKGLRVDLWFIVTLIQLMSHTHNYITRPCMLITLTATAKWS